MSPSPLSAKSGGGFQTRGQTYKKSLSYIAAVSNGGFKIPQRNLEDLYVCYIHLHKAWVSVCVRSHVWITAYRMNECVRACICLSAFVFMWQIIFPHMWGGDSKTVYVSVWVCKGVEWCRSVQMVTDRGEDWVRLVYLEYQCHHMQLPRKFTIKVGWKDSLFTQSDTKFSWVPGYLPWSPHKYLYFGFGFGLIPSQSAACQSDGQNEV